MDIFFTEVVNHLKNFYNENSNVSFQIWVEKNESEKQYLAILFSLDTIDMLYFEIHNIWKDFPDIILICNKKNEKKINIKKGTFKFSYFINEGIKQKIEKEINEKNNLNNFFKDLNNFNNLPNIEIKRGIIFYFLSLFIITKKVKENKHFLWKKEGKDNFGNKYIFYQIPKGFIEETEDFIKEINKKKENYLIETENRKKLEKEEEENRKKLEKEEEENRKKLKKQEEENRKKLKKQEEENRKKLKRKKECIKRKNKLKEIKEEEQQENSILVEKKEIEEKKLENKKKLEIEEGNRQKDNSNSEKEKEKKTNIYIFLFLVLLIFLYFFKTKYF